MLKSSINSRVFLAVVVEDATQIREETPTIIHGWRTHLNGTVELS